MFVMIRFCTFLIFCFVFSVLPLKAEQTNFIAKIDPKNVLVEGFQGWGTSLCWWANVVGAYSNRNDFADMVFKDLKFNIVRYNIGGGENPIGPGTMQFRTQMPGFEPTNGIWNWSADQNQRWMLKAALKRGVNRVEAFANSPPYWMTVSESVTGAIEGTNNLQIAHEKDFAIYLAEVVKNLSRLDQVKFDAITPVNEPTSDWWIYGGHQEGCHIDARQQARLINLLHAELENRGLDILIDAPEDNDEQSSVNSLGAYSDQALKNLGQISTHSYKANNPTGLRSLAESLHKPLRQNEYGDGDETGMKLARRIRGDLTELRPLSWCYWEAVDYGGWGMVYNKLSERGITNYFLTPKYYIFKQFSHYLPPGCNIIDCGDTNSVAGYDPKSHTLAIVTVNDTTNDFQATFDLSNFAKMKSKVQCIRTSATEKFKELPPLKIKDKRFTSDVPAGSVTTYVVQKAILR
jgi:O-glycosyl hydrolase